MAWRRVCAAPSGRFHARRGDRPYRPAGRDWSPSVSHFGSAARRI